jgi:hypothetical protein
MERFIPQKNWMLYTLPIVAHQKHKDDKYFEDINESYKLLKDQLSSIMRSLRMEAGQS